MALTKAHNRMIAGALINVLDFGATGDGVTDDRAAIQAAVDHAEAQNGGTVYFPAPSAHYLISSTHPTESCGILIDSNNVKLLGEWIAQDHEAAHVKCIFPSSTTAGLYVKGTCRGLSFEGFTIFTSYATNVALIEVAPSLHMSRCRFTCSNTTANIAAGTAATVGLMINQTYVSIIENVWATGINSFRIGDGVTGESTSVTMSSCYAQRPRDKGYHLDGVVYSTLNSCACDGADGSWSSASLISYYLDNCDTVSINSCGCETGLKAIYATTVLNLSLDGLFMSGIGAQTSGAADYLIDINGCSGTINNIRPSFVVSKYYKDQPYFLKSFNDGDQRLVVLDSTIERSQVTNDLGPDTNKNIFFINDTPQLRTYLFSDTGGTVITVPIVSQTSLWVKQLFHIRGVNADSAASNPYPFEAVISFRSLDSLADVAMNNNFGIASVAASGMNLNITLSNAVDKVTFTGDSLYHSRQDGFRLETIDWDNISFT